MERNRSWLGAGHETQRSLGGRKARWIGDSVPPIQSLRLAPAAETSKALPIAAKATAAADERGERVTTSYVTFRSFPKPAGTARESETVQI
jgi:hypothetical protein